MFNNNPIEPSANARANAHIARQVFVALTNAGFTEDQALFLVGNMVTAAILANSNTEEQ